MKMLAIAAYIHFHINILLMQSYITFQTMYVIYGYMKLSIMYVLRTAVTTGKKGWE